MVACDRLHQSAPRLCHNDGLDSLRAAMLAQFDKHLENLKGCVHWLTAHGVAIIDVDMRRGRAAPEIRVAASPYLYSLFMMDCACFERCPDGHLTREKWKTVRFDTVIWWEEAKCD
ncbi:MAG TPA: hypothetical protein VJ576_02675 [Rhodocyclaceae bacterium]|nr:hypothetical protein [Rhodocyclaceae bacterium]